MTKQPVHVFRTAGARERSGGERGESLMSSWGRRADQRQRLPRPRERCRGPSRSPALINLRRARRQATRGSTSWQVGPLLRPAPPGPLSVPPATPGPWPHQSAAPRSGHHADMPHRRALPGTPRHDATLDGSLCDPHEALGATGPPLPPRRCIPAASATRCSPTCGAQGWRQRTTGASTRSVPPWSRARSGAVTARPPARTRKKS